MHSQTSLVVASGPSRTPTSRPLTALATERKERPCPELIYLEGRQVLGKARVASIWREGEARGGGGGESSLCTPMSSLIQEGNRAPGPL